MGGDIRNALGVPRTFKGFLWSKIIDAMVGAGSVAQGDILYRNATIWTRLAAGTSGRVLRTNGAGADPSWASPASGSGGALSHVHRETVAGSAASSIVVGSLDLTADEAYIITLNAQNATGSTTGINFFLNGDTTVGNYDRQSVTANTNTISASRANDASVGSIVGSQWIIQETTMPLMFDREGKPRCMITTNSSVTTAILFQQFAYRWRTAANVTSLGFYSAAGTSIFDIGSYVDVWKRTTS